MCESQFVIDIHCICDGSKGVNDWFAKLCFIDWYTFCPCSSFSMSSNPYQLLLFSPSFSAGSDVRVLVGHAGSVYCMTFNTDNSFLASGSEDGTGEMV